MFRDVKEKFPFNIAPISDDIPDRLAMTPNNKTSIGVWNCWSVDHPYRIKSVGYTDKKNIEKWKENS